MQGRRPAPGPLPCMRRLRGAAGTEPDLDELFLQLDRGREDGGAAPAAAKATYAAQLQAAEPASDLRQLQTKFPLSVRVPSSNHGEALSTGRRCSHGVGAVPRLLPLGLVRELCWLKCAALAAGGGAAALLPAECLLHVLRHLHSLVSARPGWCTCLLCHSNGSTLSHAAAGAKATSSPPASRCTPTHSAATTLPTGRSSPPSG